jgi:putative PIN family toxin of toxin-antitoxin system
VVSGLLWLGNPGRLFEAAADGQVTLYTSPALVGELSATLSAPKLKQRLERSGLTREELLTRYLNVAIPIQPGVVARVVPDDPDDDQVLACALVANADLIVSGDGDLLQLKEHAGIQIVTAAQAVERLTPK